MHLLFFSQEISSPKSSHHFSSRSTRLEGVGGHDRHCLYRRWRRRCCWRSRKLCCSSEFHKAAVVLHRRHRPSVVLHRRHSPFPLLCFIDDPLQLCCASSISLLLCGFGRTFKVYVNLGFLKLDLVFIISCGILLFFSIVFNEFVVVCCSSCDIINF